MRVSSIHFEKVPEPTLASLFLKKGISDLNQFRSIGYDKNKEPYRFHSKTYFVEEPIEKVWGVYLHAHPRILWDSNIIKFQILFERTTDEVKYRDDAFDRLAVGQIYFVDMKIIPGFHIPVLHEIAAVDVEKMVLQTNYLHTGKSEGSQWIRLFPGKDGGTEIVHETRYKGTNVIRDGLLYPYFHTKAIDEFHSNAKRALKSKV